MSIALATMLSAASAIHAAPKPAAHTEVRHEQPARRVDNDRHETKVVYRNDRDRGHGPVVIRERPIVYAPTVTIGYTVPQYAYQPQPVAVLGATALDGGTLTVDMPYGMGTLDLDAVGPGSTYVGNVVLYYSGGGYQVVPVNQALDAANPVFHVSLGANVTRIAVSGRSDCGGSLAIDAV